MEDLDISHSKIAESAQRVVDRAIEEARRRGQGEFTSAHLFLAFGQVEWDTFSESMRDLDLNPHEVLKAVEEHVQAQTSTEGEGPELRASTGAKLALRSAFHHASCMAPAIESPTWWRRSDQSHEAPRLSSDATASARRRRGARATHFRDSEMRESSCASARAVNALNFGEPDRWRGRCCRRSSDATTRSGGAEVQSHREGSNP
jgi:ATP-dependent Clp protease ATP-binding subunit ClpA